MDSELKIYSNSKPNSNKLSDTEKRESVHGKTEVKKSRWTVALDENEQKWTRGKLVGTVFIDWHYHISFIYTDAAVMYIQRNKDIAYSALFHITD
jgi:hypothetical protein